MDDTTRPAASQSAASFSSSPVAASSLSAQSGSRFVDELRRRLSTHNPLYAVSAALVFYGLRISFQVEAAEHAFVLLSALSAYVVLLTTTAILLRYVGALWEDVRMLALLVLLLLLGISVTFDRTVLVDASVGRACFFIAWLFSALVCEVLFAGLRVRMPLGYRLPFHALLALFFVYPPLAAHWAAEPDDGALTWWLCSFTSAAAVLLLTTIPAARRGAAYVADNGTPWNWPWFPATLFFVLGLGVVGRAYYLCYSFHAAPDGESIFGAYFLTPLVLAVGTIMLAAGRRMRTRIVALTVPVVCLLMAGVQPRGDLTFDGFLFRFYEQFGAGPQAVALWAGIVFYGFAVVRSVPGSWVCLFGAVLLTTVVRGPAWEVWAWDTIPPWSFAAAAFIAGVAAVRHDQVTWAWAATICMGLATAVAASRLETGPVVFTSYHAAVLTAAGFAAFFGRDRGVWLRVGVAGLLLLAFTEAVTDIGPGLFRQTPTAKPYYPIVVLTLATAYVAARRDWPALYFFVALSAEWLAAVVGREYVHWRRLVPGLDAIALGLATFVAALLLSLSKSERFMRLRGGDEPSGSATEEVAEPLGGS